jgi:hypothetical protein
VSGPVSADLHRFIVNPENSSLVLSAARHLLYRPADFLYTKLRGLPENARGNLWHGLNPETWGAGLARAGERADASLGRMTGGTRKEMVTLNRDHLQRIGDTLADWERRPDMKAHAGHVRKQFDDLLHQHHAPGTTLDQVLQNSRSADNYKVTLHDVLLPSATGEVGKTVKTIAADGAALYGSAEIVNQVNRVADQKTPSSEDRMSDMAAVKAALEQLEKAARILEEIPARDRAYKQASSLYQHGAIMEHEVEKYAALFFENPDSADVVAQGLLRNSASEVKSARLGEVVSGGSASTGGSRYSSFDAMCLEGLTK